MALRRACAAWLVALATVASATSSTEPSTVAVSEHLAGVGEIIWQRPSGPVRGLVLSIHGCCGTAINSFAPSVSCPRCYYMPVENRQREMCMAHGLMFLALSSTDRISGCWSKGKDVLAGEMERIRRALQHVRAKLDNVPWYVIGTSSGGIVALQMPMHGLYPDGIISVVMGVPSHMLSAADGRPFPPTAFIHMVRDRGSRQLVRKNVRYLNANTPTLELPLEPSPISLDFFSERDPTISTERSAALAVALKRGGFLNARLQLKSDPRYSPWRAIVGPVGSFLAGSDSLVRFFSPMDEHLVRLFFVCFFPVYASFRVRFISIISYASFVLCCTLLSPD